MPRFYFHLINEMTVQDHEGKELPDLDAARAEAERNAREMACAGVMAGRLRLTDRIDVADESGTLVLSVSFADIVQVEA